MWSKDHMIMIYRKKIVRLPIPKNPIYNLAVLRQSSTAGINIRDQLFQSIQLLRLVAWSFGKDSTNAKQGHLSGSTGTFEVKIFSTLAEQSLKFITSTQIETELSDHIKSTDTEIPAR